MPTFVVLFHDQIVQKSMTKRSKIDKTGKISQKQVTRSRGWFTELVFIVNVGAVDRFCLFALFLLLNEAKLHTKCHTPYAGV